MDYTYTGTFDPAAAAAVTGAGLAWGVGMIIFWIVFGGLGFVLWLWALIDCVRREFPNPNDKIIWLLVILLLWTIGPIIYLVAGRKKGTIPAK